MSFGRNFPIKEGRANLQFRIEFQNIFNRLFYSQPAVSGGFNQVNPATPTAYNNPNGGLSAGYGYVNYINGGCMLQGSVSGFLQGQPCGAPRTGQAVLRLTW